MDGDFSFLKWLAELLGPGGFVAAVAAGGSCYLNWRQLNWSRRDAATFQLATASLAKDLNDKHNAAFLALTSECHTERSEWATRLDKVEMARDHRAALARKDAKEWYGEIGRMRDGMKELSGQTKRLAAKMGEKPRRRR